MKREPKVHSEKFYRKRSKVLRGAGLTTIGLTTTGGFFAYQSIIDWNNFKKDLTDFVVVNQENVKLNLAIALPFMIGMIVFLIVMLKKNKEFFSDKISMSLLIAVLFTYLIYSIVEVTLFSLIGAFTGSLIDETLFNNLAKRDKIRAGDEKEYTMEKRKEQIRLKARAEARANNDGSV